MRKSVARTSDRDDTDRTVKPQRIARGLKVRTSEDMGLHNLCNENKGVNMLL